MYLYSTNKQPFCLFFRFSLQCLSVVYRHRSHNQLKYGEELNCGIQTGAHTLDNPSKNWWSYVHLISSHNLKVEVVSFILFSAIQRAQRLTTDSQSTLSHTIERTKQ